MVPDVLSEEEKKLIVEIIEKNFEKKLIIEKLGERDRYSIEDFYMLFNEPNLLQRFYNALVREFKGLPTISPIHDPEWSKEASKWLCGGKVVAELGCGDGTFAKQVLSTSSCNINEYYIVDFSEDVLKAAIDSIKKSGKNGRYIPENWNIEHLSEESGFENKFDRVIAINTFGDTRVEYAFKEVHKVLKNKGQLRATLYSKETYDKFWKPEYGSTYFNISKDFGLWFTPLDFYKGHYDPMGHIFIGDRFKDFVRIQRYYTKDGWIKILEKIGFKVVKCNCVKYPKSMVQERWGRFGKRLSDFMDEHDGFPECWDIIVEKE